MANEIKEDKKQSPPAAYDKKDSASVPPTSASELAPIAQGAKKKAKVNMMLPSGTILVVGEPVVLSKQDEAYLASKFKKEDIPSIVE